MDRTRRPAPDDPSEEGLQIQLLGAFDIRRNGDSVRHGRKVPQKPLALLKLLVAHGAREVDTTILAELLWPDLEGDAACAAFEVTLHRLRGLLGVKNVLRRVNGRLSLDPVLCQTDVWRFEVVAKAVIDVLPSWPAAEEATLCREQMLKLLDAYPGHFLEQDSHDAWVHVCRDRLRERFQRAVLHLGRRLENLLLWSDAAALYSRALEIDNLAEPLHRRLMLCCCELGEAAEAMRTYRRCRLLLATALGVPPSAETETIRMRISCTVPAPLE